MAKPILRVLLKGPFEDVFRFTEALLHPLGLLLANPESGRITHWTDDGDQIAIPRNTIVDEVRKGTMKNVQFWSGPGHDLFVSWVAISAGWQFSFYLDGVSEELKRKLAATLSNAVLTDLKLQYVEECAFKIDFD